MLISALSKRAKIAIAVAAIASAGFVVAAVVTYVRQGDWPARYLSAAATILLVIVIALRRRAKRQQAK